ncbi:MAG: preprotein translocase subunit Sec61beta [Nanoarchaeota archaeon]
MAEDKIQMPSGMGGLVRYFDDYQSKLEFRPIILVFVILAVIIFELLLHYKVFG